jgi:hypothetical protein
MPGPAGLMVTGRSRCRPGSALYRPWVPPVSDLSNLGWTQQWIVAVNPPIQYGTELLLSWVSVAPIADGLVYQVYEDQALVWSGTGTTATVPLPTGVGRIDIGNVGAANAQVNYLSALAAAPDRRVVLSWLGGTYEALDIAGFYVYGSDVAGGAVDYGKTLGTVPAYTAGIVTDGFGYGGFGYGGFGESAGSYTWTSEPYAGGTWNFGVVPFDTAGNLGTARTVAVAVNAPPLEPAPFGFNDRLHYTYNSGTHVAILTWNASPG